MAYPGRAMSELQNYIEWPPSSPPAMNSRWTCCPEAVRGQKRPRIDATSPLIFARFRRTGRIRVDSRGGPTAKTARENRQRSGTRTDRPGPGPMRQRPDQGGRAARHQPQHASKEVKGIRSGRLTAPPHRWFSLPAANRPCERTAIRRGVAVLGFSKYVALTSSPPAFPLVPKLQLGNQG